MRFGYPVFLDLHGVPVLVVGAGAVGVRKIRGLVTAGANVHVVALDIDESLDRSSLAGLRQQPYEPSDLDGKRLVITATGVPAVDANVASDAKEQGIWVNAADQTDDCTFILPAIARADDLTVAVSSDGTAPAVASWLRDRIRQEILDDETRRIAASIAERRRHIHAAGRSTEEVDWRAEIGALRRR
ncbi:MAG: bifunctional precorrin-2 dehydrogenase/sirohydrochlorin ferrochelatase [Actinomycetota bacterium]|nr:bifunctional precorrin-2 dehydrogenase/sirohydrochlorin ferrochelatase [Actinomycetota bacterium]